MTQPSPFPHFNKLSIVIPVYNEEATIQELIRLVIASVLPAHLEREIIWWDPLESTCRHASLSIL